MLWIIGLEELFLSADVSEEFLDSQIDLIKSLILSGWNGGGASLRYVIGIDWGSTTTKFVLWKD